MKMNQFGIFLAGALAAASIQAQGVTPRYTLRDLDTLQGGNFSQATSLNNRGLVSGLSTAADGTQHAVIWYRAWIGDLGANLLGGPNSGAFAVNVKGQVLGQAESSDKDPNNENFCGYGTGLKCLPFLWQFGVTTPLPLLGGNNGSVGMINNRGEAVGFAETAIHDPDCPTQPAANGSGPQVLDFEAVLWGPNPGEIRELSPLPGDSVGMAFWINNQGQAVGTTGSCANTVVPGFAIGPHAVIWEQDGSVHDLGNLGGTANPAALGVGNVAFAINNHGQVAGISALAGSTTTHPFLWTPQTGMQDLGLLSGDFMGAALGINDNGDVVGASISAPGLPQGNPRAFLWHDGVMIDLNTLVPADSPLYLLTAFAINDEGEIVGFGVQKDAPNQIHGFRATPDFEGYDDSGQSLSASQRSVTSPMSLPDDARKLLFRGLGMGRR